MADVRIEGISKWFGQAVAVNDLSLHVLDREFVSLLGPSGCGKTTTMRCVAGLERPDVGEIYIGDRRVTNLPPKARDVALVFRSYALYPHMTTEKHHRLSAQAAGNGARAARNGDPRHRDDVRDRRAARAVSETSYRPGSSSGSGASRAVVREPKAFLMDEPLSNIDALCASICAAN